MDLASTNRLRNRLTWLFLHLSLTVFGLSIVAIEPRQLDQFQAEIMSAAEVARSDGGLTSDYVEILPHNASLSMDA